MKSICYIKKWQEEAALRGDMYSSRILVIKLGGEDPLQYTHMVNALFAAQKLGILIDSLIL